MEIPRPDTSNLDPSQQGVQEYTIAQLRPAEYHRAEQIMRGSEKIRLAEGTTLAEQANQNYGYLNERGISMGQLLETAEGLQAIAKQNTEAEDERMGDLLLDGSDVQPEGLDPTEHLRADGRKERLYHSGGTISGIVLDPATGDKYKDSGVVLDITLPEGVEPGKDDRLMHWHGPFLLDAEVAALKKGIFGATQQHDVPGSCRAEQMIKHLEATEIGLQLLDAHKPDPNGYQPIALVTAPEINPDNPPEIEPTAEQATTREKLADMKAVIDDLQEAAPTAWKEIGGSSKFKELQRDLPGSTPDTLETIRLITLQHSTDKTQRTVEITSRPKADPDVQQSKLTISWTGKDLGHIYGIARDENGQSIVTHKVGELETPSVDPDELATVVEKVHTLAAKVQAEEAAKPQRPETQPEASQAPAQRSGRVTRVLRKFGMLR